ncbi:Mediator of RNA polymerase II transcription subunit 14 [Nymphon striatum]|nr:Mediator of RNA polymerase II transcription subunit 14 [Nymphon striatum]
MAPIPIEGHHPAMLAGPMSAVQAVGNQSPPGGATIPLGLLIDFCIQQTYHELSVLAELRDNRYSNDMQVELGGRMPRKNDIERKIAIVQFASKSRQLFVRLLALVKWANSASKVEKCSSIMAFLDKQSMLFVDTADMLSRLARETLVTARLPNFHLPCAVEVLTTGTYLRLPSCIRDKIVPPEPITAVERKSTLQRLNQIIQHRLVTSELPAQMRNFKIDNSDVEYEPMESDNETIDSYESDDVLSEHEDDSVMLSDSWKRIADIFSDCRPNSLPELVRNFSGINPALNCNANNSILENFKKFITNDVFLTMMGDNFSIPWRLLGIEFLVEDKETGDGKALVHSLQTQYIEQLIQSRLIDNPTPLHDIYDCLHSFCQSLQLEVLHSQAYRLMNERLGDYIRIEEYNTGKNLTTSYWREMQSKECDNLGYRITIQVDRHNSFKPLQAIHLPPLNSEELLDTEQAIRCDHLSIENLLVQTIFIRSKQKLTELKEFIDKNLSVTEMSVSSSPAILHVPILKSDSSEQLLISIDTHTGIFLVLVPKYDIPIVNDIQNALNKNKNDGRTRFLELLKKLKFWMIYRRCEKTIHSLPAIAMDKLPLILPDDHEINKLGPYKLFVKLRRHPNCYLVVDLIADCDDPDEVTQEFYLLTVKPTSFEEEVIPVAESPLETSTKAFLLVSVFRKLDSFGVTHGTCTAVESINSKYSGLGKRISDVSSLAEVKHPKYSRCFVSKLAHVIALCDERIPFSILMEELSRRGIAHQGIQVEAHGNNLTLGIVKHPQVPGVSKTTYDRLYSQMLSCKIRIQGKGARCWLVEYVFCKCPLSTTSNQEQEILHPVYFLYELSTQANISKMVDSFIQDWTVMCQLHECVLSLATALSQETPVKYLADIEVKSYNYKRLVLGYGPNKAFVVIIQKRSEKGFHLSFCIGGKAGSSSNPHSAVSLQLHQLFNRKPDIVHFMQGIITSRPKVPVPTFIVMPQSPTHFRIAYRSFFCIDIQCRGDGLIAVRDGAFSLFDKAKPVNEFMPAQGLKALLLLRKGSQDSAGLRFTHPMTPPSVSSNPHTPASPHASVMSQQSFTASPAASSFPLASPPSLQHNINPSPSMMHMNTPSPVTMLSANSPSNPLHAPSPVGAFLPTPSPSSQNQVQHMQSPAQSYIPGHTDGGSPFPSSYATMPSPSIRWPGSPSVPGPSPASRGGMAPSPGGSHFALQSPQAGNASDHTSISTPRILPQRSWAAATPTILTHESLAALCTPSPLQLSPGNFTNGYLSAIERFLGCAYMRRNMLKVIQSEDSKPESLQCKIWLNYTHMQMLHLKLNPTPEYADQWLTEDLLILEKFFDAKVASYPYKPNAFIAFSKIITSPFRLLKDCVSIMKMEMVADRMAKWTIKWCLTSPVGSPQIVPPGMSGVFVINTKVLFYFQLTRVGLQIPHGLTQTYTIPIVYDMNANVTSMADVKRDHNNPPPTSPYTIIQNTLKRFCEVNPRPLNECSFAPAVRELVTNLVIPVPVHNSS